MRTAEVADALRRVRVAIPVAYNLLQREGALDLLGRWPVLGIAGTVGVFVAMLALARGFKATAHLVGPAARTRSCSAPARTPR